MKRKMFHMIGTVYMLMTLTGMTGCDNADNVISYEDHQEALYGEWRLVGWNNKEMCFEVDTNYVSHRHLSIEIPQEGIVKAYSIANEVVLGKMAIRGNELLFSGGRGMTQVLCDIKESLFFEEHIFDVRFYQLSENLLRLYYSDNDYFVFTRDFDDSEDNLYAWKDLMAGPYIGEVSSYNSDKIEVRIIHHPSSTFGYSRNDPPSVDNYCHITTSDLSGLSFTTGDRIAFQIMQFRRLKVENERLFECKVKPCDGSEHVDNMAGIVHFDTYRREWCIIAFKNQEKSLANFYFLMKPLPKSLLSENQPVVFSGALYPTWIMPSGLSYHADSCFFVNINTLIVNGQEIDMKRMVISK